MSMQSDVYNLKGHFDKKYPVKLNKTKLFIVISNQ